LVVLLEAIQYGGADRDRERMLCVPEFLTGEAKRWYARHVVHVNRSQLSWTFEDVIVGLYDRFTHPTTMQEARDAYAAAKYSSQLGIQGFYDTLIDHAQNMSVYPDAYNIMDTFLCGLPKEMRTKMLENGLTPEANTVDDFVSEGKALEAAMKTMEHYDRHSTRRSNTPNLQSQHETKLKKVGITFMKKSEFDGRSHGSRTQVLVNDGASSHGHGLITKPHAHYHMKEKQEPSSDKPQIPPDKNNHGIEAAVICYNCGGLGHYSRDCKKPRKAKDHIRAAHTEVADQPTHKDDERAPSECGSQQSAASQGGQSEEDHLVEVDVYENDWYEREDDTDRMFTIGP
jgi:hypothetical protein